MTPNEIEKRSLIIREEFGKKRDDLFANIFKFTKVEHIKAVYPVSGGTEIVFVSQQGLKKFLSDIPQQWKVEHSETVRSVLVTVVPRVGDGHAQISDATIIAALSQYGDVEEGLRKTYRSFPTIETGAKLLKVKPKGSVSQLPTSLYFGKSIFGVVYQGQEQSCHRCGGSHKVTECKSVVCFKCRRMGHMSSGCRNPIVCTVCLKAGHSFKNCPAVKALGDVTLGTKWTKVVAGNIESCELAVEGLNADLESKGACGFSGGLTHINDGQVRTKVSYENIEGYGFSNQKPIVTTGTSTSNVMVGPIIKTAGEEPIPPTPWERRDSDTPSDDDLFEAANMSQRRQSHVSETDSETDSGSTLLDLLNKEEANDGGYVPSSQDLFTSQASPKDPLSHKRSRSLDRSIEADGSSSKLTKSGDP